MAPADAVTGADDQARIEAWPLPARAWGVTALLMMAYFVAYVDRTIISLLVGPIKKSLELSDTKIGLLQSAFGLFFTLATFPAGWIADKGNRTRLIAWAIGIWAFMTALCGMCTNFIQLFLARMGVAVGEAVLTPTAPSLIADNFPPERRTLPLSLYGMAGSSGMGVSLVTGGFVASLLKDTEIVTIPGLGAFAPWQVIFFAVGLPGLLVSLLFFFAREPERREKGKASSSFDEFFDILKSRRAIILPHFAGVCVYFIQAFAFVAWMPAFIMRVHGWSIADVGMKYGALHIVCAIFGGILGGWLARVLWTRGWKNANLFSSAAMMAANALPAVLGTLLSNMTLALVMIALAKIVSIATAGPNVAALQEIIPNRFRGRVTALYFAIISLIGVTLGPLVIGVMNDYVFTDEMSIGKSLALTSGLCLPLASLLIFIAARNRLRLDWVN